MSLLNSPFIAICALFGFLMLACASMGHTAETSYTTSQIKAHSNLVASVSKKQKQMSYETASKIVYLYGANE